LSKPLDPRKLWALFDEYSGDDGTVTKQRTSV
jgi:hypothetical protein